MVLKLLLKFSDSINNPDTILAARSQRLRHGCVLSGVTILARAPKIISSDERETPVGNKLWNSYLFFIDFEVLSNLSQGPEEGTVRFKRAK